MRLEFKSSAISLKALVALILMALAPLTAQTPVQMHGRLHVSGNRIMDQNGKPVSLNGMAFFWSQWMPQYYNSGCVKWLANDWKCSILRASMAVEAGGYLSNPGPETAKVRAIVDAAIAEGIYVVVDFHETEDGASHLSQAKAFFKEVSAAYASVPNIIYETWNEPLPGYSWSGVIKPYHQALINVIRANDPDNLILCGTRSWSQEVEEASLDPIKDAANIVYTLHFYAATHRQSLRDKAAKALANGIPLMVTEGGLSEASGGGALDTSEARRWVDFLKQNSISWMNWSVGDKSESSAALQSGASGSGGWSLGQLTPSGTWVRNAIRQSSEVRSLVLMQSPFNRWSLTVLDGMAAGQRDAMGRDFGVLQAITNPAGQLDTWTMKFDSPAK